MNKFILLVVISCITTSALNAQDSVFIPDRYKWDLGLRLKPSSNYPEPISVMLKKNVSAKKAWRFGVGFNYNTQFENDLMTILDNDATKTFIITNIDRKSTNLFVAASVGYQRNHSFKNLNLYYGIDLILNYQLNKIDLPHGIGYPSHILPDSSYYVTANYNTLRGYGLSISPCIGGQYGISRKLSVSCELSAPYKAVYFRNQEFYYSLATDSIGNIGFGHTDEYYLYHWSHSFVFNLVPLITLSYHFD